MMRYEYTGQNRMSTRGREVVSPVPDVRVPRQAPAGVSNVLANPRRGLKVVRSDVGPDVFYVVASLGSEAEAFHPRWR